MSRLNTLLLHSLFVVALSAAAPPSVAAGEGGAALYSIKLLELRVATALNNRAEVVGHAPLMRAAVTGPQGQGLRVIEGMSEQTTAVDINARGQLVVASFNGHTNPILTEPHGADPSALGFPGLPRGLNHRGQVVGETQGEAFVTGPDGRGLRLLGRLFPEDTGSSAFAINEAGYVVGASYSGTHLDAARAFITGPQGTGMRQLHGLDGHSEAYDINARGEVIGQWRSSSADPFRCFQTARHGGPMVDIGTLGGSLCVARSINNKGDVVGASYISGDTELHAFVKLAGQAALLDLNELIDRSTLADGEHLQFAHGVNDKGQIIAASSAERAYLLTPRQSK